MRGVTVAQKRIISLSGKKILVTGAAGFIGAALVLELIKTVPDARIIGVDDLNDYYDPALKEYRLREIEKAAAERKCGWLFVKGSICDRDFTDGIFKDHRPDVVVHLAAQAGVRYSIDHPDVYIQSNIIGFYNMLEGLRHWPAEHFVFASSSSVYGGNTKVPFSVEDKTDSPVSLYAATKKADELLTHAYTKLYGIPATGLRFFTVYGPAGRPDMFYYSATEKLVKGEKIKLFNYGDCRRDFTYVDDVVRGLTLVMAKAPEDPKFCIYNIGGGRPEDLKEFVFVLHEELKLAGVLPEDHELESSLEYVGMQPGDVVATFADSAPLEEEFGFRPAIDIRQGLRSFAQWYASYRRDIQK